MILKCDKTWDDDGIDPLRGPRGDTAFLKENYRCMEIGGVFRTPSARFSHAKIHAGARKAGFIVEIVNEGPWAKVTVVGKLPPACLSLKKPKIYLGAGKEYPNPKSRPAAKVDPLS